MTVSPKPGPWPGSAAPPPGWNPPPAGRAPRPAPAADPSTSAADRRLLVGGVACIALTLAGVLLRLTGLLPSGIATVVVLIVAAVGLRLYVRYTAKAASSAHRTRVSKLIALVGLAVSVVTVVASLPVLLRGGGSGTFVENILAHLWTVLLLVVAVGNARTLGWLPLVAMGVAAFLGLSGLAYTVGRPVVDAMGVDSVFATAVYAPVTEEIIKALPVVLLLVFAARRTYARPSASEMALLGACVGAGFALYEDVQFHRGGFHWAMPLVSLVEPSADSDGGFGITYAAAGHMVYTAVIALGLAVTLLYRRRSRWAVLAAPVAFVEVVLEHITQNYAAAVAAGSGSEPLFDLLRVVTLWGWLSSLLLIGGVGWFAWTERKAVGTAGIPFPQSLIDSVWRRPPAVTHAATALARFQGPVPSTAPTAVHPPLPGGVR